MKTTLRPLTGPEQEAALMLLQDEPLDIIERETGLTKAQILAARDLQEQWAKVPVGGSSNGHALRPPVRADMLVPAGVPRRAADPVFRAPVPAAAASAPKPPVPAPALPAETKPDPVTVAALDEPPLAVEIDVPVFDRRDANAVIAEAEKSSDSELRAEALAIRGFIAALEARLAVTEEERVARIMVDELGKQLVKAEARLAELLAAKQGPTASVATPAPAAVPAKSKPAPPWPNPGDVRAWAATKGLKVAAAGRVPRDVVARYVAAHPEARAKAAS